MLQDQHAPPCPITGAPARRLIQTVSTALLINLWRYGGGVDVSRLLKGKRIALWESPCGLAFFDPMIAGDGDFYWDYYKRLHPTAHRSRLRERSDFLAAARFVGPGDRVLDVASATAEFRHYVPDARYVGIEPYVSALTGQDEEPGLIRESLEAHALAHAGGYDVVCGFQVIEHVSDPLAFAKAMLSLVRPGGLLILAAPSWPSAMTDIPNCMGNAVPHHLSWWTKAAFAALAERLGGEVVAIEDLAPNRHQILFHWASLVSPVKARTTFFEARFSWLASLFVAYFGAVVAALPGKLPKDARSMDILLALRKTGGG